MTITILHKKLYKKLLLVFALNLVDWLCTVVLLGTGLFQEANPLMREIIGNLPQGFFAKCLFPAAAIFAVMVMLRWMEVKELRIADRFISFVLVFYLAIDLDHILNFLLLFFREFQILT